MIMEPILITLTVAFYIGAVVSWVRATRAAYFRREKPRKKWIILTTWCAAAVTILLIVAEMTA